MRGPTLDCGAGLWFRGVCHVTYAPAGDVLQTTSAGVRSRVTESAVAVVHTLPLTVAPRNEEPNGGRKITLALIAVLISHRTVAASSLCSE